jgi:hypothetical protein
LFPEIRNFLSKSNLDVVLTGFCILAALNAISSFLGSSAILSATEGHWWGAVLVNFVFDSWGTFVGLLGSVLLFLPVLLGSPANQRKVLSTYFLSMSITIGVGSSLLWNYLFGSGAISYGSSAIDIAAQSIIFTLASFALVRSFLGRAEGSQSDPYIRNSFRVIYATIVLTTVWFIFYLQPIFVSTNQFNWRVHEIAFISGILLTGSFLAILKYRTVRKIPVKEPSELELATRNERTRQAKIP